MNTTEAADASSGGVAPYLDVVSAALRDEPYVVPAESSLPESPAEQPAAEPAAEQPAEPAAEQPAEPAAEQPTEPEPAAEPTAVGQGQKTALADPKAALLAAAGYAACYARFVRDSALRRRWGLDHWQVTACLATVLSVFHGPRARGYTLMDGVVTAVAAAAVYLDAFSYADAMLQNVLFFVLPTLLQRPADEPWSESAMWAVAMRLAADVAYDAVLA